jgi:hypothetical protein
MLFLYAHDIENQYLYYAISLLFLTDVVMSPAIYIYALPLLPTIIPAPTTTKGKKERKKRRPADKITDYVYDM